MENRLDIAEVVRRTGLTSRALRFYEERGLVSPLRTQSGRRRYGAGELERINQVVALRKAGLSIAQIQGLIGRQRLDLGRLIDAQLAAIDEQSRTLAEAKALLLTAKARVEGGAPIDIETFCALIRNGDGLMKQDQWETIAERYLTPEARAEWAARVPAEFDGDGYHGRWRELGERIEAALPLDPSSSQAQAFAAEWFALLQPFTAVATPGMWEGTQRMYDDMDNWSAQADPGFSKRVWEFMKQVAIQRMAAGGTA